MTTIQRRIAAGLCRDCGDEPPVPGLQRCQPCREIQNARVVSNNAKKRAAGLVRRWVPDSKAVP